MELKNEFIIVDEEKLFNQEYEIIKPNLSIYARNEIRGINRAFCKRAKVGEDKLVVFPEVDISKKSILKELKRIVIVIRKHPSLGHILEEIFNETVLMTESCNDYEEILVRIVKLEAALKMSINLLYGNAISTAFDDIYMNIVNEHYTDIYGMESSCDFNKTAGRSL